MAMQLTPLGRALVVLSGLSMLGYAAYKYGLVDKLAPAAREQGSLVPEKAELPEVVGGTTGAVAPVAMPGSGAGCADKTEVRMLIWAWNSQMGMMFANGGRQATEGSLMCEHGVNLQLTREDDAGKMQEALVTFAPVIALGLTREGVIDVATDKPIEIVFLILSPARTPDFQVKLLGLASRASQNRALMQALRSVRTPEEAMRAIHDWEASI